MTPELKGYLLLSAIKMLIVFTIIMIGVALLTLMERKVNGVEYESWYGFFAPAGTPRPVIERLHAEISKVVRDKAYIDEKLGRIGLEGFDTPTPAAASAFLRSFHDRIAPVVKKAGIKVD